MLVTLEERRPKRRPKHLDSLKQEQELISKARLGNLEECFSLLDQIIVNIKTLEGSIYDIKARVIELMFVLSRAIVEGGGDYGKVSKINCQLMRNMNSMEDIEAISTIANQTLLAYIESKPRGSSRGHRIIKEVKAFITENYFRQLTLGEIAQAVYISPFYLSHLFKEVEGLTLINYLTNLRMEKAKILLRNSKYKIHQVSKKLGYNNPSYFTKLFRKVEGQTPSQFRKLVK